MFAMITFPDMVKIFGGLLLLIFLAVTALGIYFVSRSNTPQRSSYRTDRAHDSRTRSKRHHRDYD